jgi:hypothetical protein
LGVEPSDRGQDVNQGGLRLLLNGRSPVEEPYERDQDRLSDHPITQRDQDSADEKARQKATRDLIQSWMDRLQLISVIVGIFWEELIFWSLTGRVLDNFLRVHGGWASPDNCEHQWKYHGQ